MGPRLWAAILATGALAAGGAPSEAGDEEIIGDLDFFMNMEVAESYDVLDLVESDEQGGETTGRTGGGDDANEK